MTAAQPAPTLGNMDLGKYVSQAWALITQNLALFLVSYLIVGLLTSIPLVGLVIGGPLLIGFYRVMQRRIQGEQPAMGDVFQGFQQFGRGFITMLLLLLCGIAIAIPVVIIVVLLMFIPCLGHILAVLLYLAVALVAGAFFYFVWPIVVFTEASPTEAISKSIKFAMANLWPMVLLNIVTGLIAGAGMIVCGVGMIFTVPLALAIQVYAYTDFYLPKAQPAA